MSLLKSVASQYAILYAYNNTTMAPVTGDSGNFTTSVALDGGARALAANLTAEIDAVNFPGYYRYPFSQAETNANTVLVGILSGTANVRIEPREYHTTQWLYDGLTFETVIETIMAALFGVATKTGTGVTYTLRDGTTLQLTVTHDALGNRTVSTIT